MSRVLSIKMIVAVLPMLLFPTLLWAQNGLSGSPQRTLQEPRATVPESPPRASQASGRRIPRPSRSITPAASNKSDSDRRGSSVWMTCAALSIVVIGILAAAKFFQKHAPLASAGIPAEALEFLGKRYVDRRHTIHLVRLGSRVLLLGSTTDGLQTLCEVTEPVEVDYLAGLCRQSKTGNSVSQSFRSLFIRRSASIPPPDSGPSLNSPLEEGGIQGGVTAETEDEFPQETETAVKSSPLSLEGVHG